MRTILGVSNISFGLPCRPYLNTTFLTMAMYAGLDLAIMNPSSEEMMAAVYAYKRADQPRPAEHQVTLSGMPTMCLHPQPSGRPHRWCLRLRHPHPVSSAELTGPYAPLMKAVEKGLKGDAAAQTKALLAEKQPLEVVDEALIPALDIVGAKYEKGTLFLPQLLQAASAAQSAFEEIKNVIAQKGEGSASKGRIVLATVKGDVHDIGKNIVKVILENYGFEVIDLGRDVPVETVVNTVREKECASGGPFRPDDHYPQEHGGNHCRPCTKRAWTARSWWAVRCSRRNMPKKIGADWYAKDAKRSADIAKDFFGAQ